MGARDVPLDALPPRLSFDGARALKAQLLEAIATPNPTLDARAVTAVDAAGLQLLIAAARAARARGGRLTLHEPSPALLRALALAGLTAALDTAEDAP